MSDGKNNRVREVDFIWVLVDGSRDNRRVDNDGVIRGHGFTAELHAGVLRWKVDANVFVQDEGNPNLTCNRSVENVQSVENGLWSKNVLCGHVLFQNHGTSSVAMKGSISSGF